MLPSYQNVRFCTFLNCSSRISLINLEPNGDSVFVNLSWDNLSGSDQSNPPSENLESGQNLVESSSNKIENSLALDSSSGSVSSPPQKKTKMTIETAETSEPVTQRPKNKGFWSNTFNRRYIAESVRGQNDFLSRLENFPPKRPNSQSKIGLNSGQKWPQTD